MSNPIAYVAYSQDLGFVHVQRRGRMPHTYYRPTRPSVNRLCQAILNTPGVVIPKPDGWSWWRKEFPR